MKDTIDHHAINDLALDKTKLHTQLVQELRGMHALLNTILGDEKLLATITDHYWTKYLALKEGQAAQPELDLNHTEHGRTSGR